MLVPSVFPLTNSPAVAPKFTFLQHVRLHLSGSSAVSCVFVVFPSQLALFHSISTTSCVCVCVSVCDTRTTVTNQALDETTAEHVCVRSCALVNLLVMNVLVVAAFACQQLL